MIDPNNERCTWWFVRDNLVSQSHRQPVPGQQRQHGRHDLLVPLEIHRVGTLDPFGELRVKQASERRVSDQRSEVVSSLNQSRSDTHLSCEQSTPILVFALNLIHPPLPSMIPPAQWLTVIGPPNRRRPYSGTWRVSSDHPRLAAIRFHKKARRKTERKGREPVDSGR
jgi:hypothetical protein